MPVTTADNKIRNQLKETRDKLAAARQKRADVIKERDAAKEAFAGVDVVSDVKITDMPEFKAAEEAVKKVGQVDDEIGDLKQTESAFLSMLGEDSSSDREAPEHRGGEIDASGFWDGHRLLQGSEDYREALDRGLFDSTAKFGTVNFGEVASRETAIQFLQNVGQRPMAAVPGAAGGVVSSTINPALPPDYRGIIQPRLMPLSLLDLIPTGTTDSNVIQYVQVTGIPEGAAETAEHALKPELGLTMDDATAPVRTIAGWIKASRQSLDDVAGLATLINTLLPYDVRRRILNQVLAGDGTGQNLLGIYNTTGVASPSAVAGDNVADAILRAMTVVILSDSDPNFVALNPITWQSLLLMREGSALTDTTANPAAFKGEYLLGGPGMVTSPTLWGLTLTQSRAIPQAHPLVGDAMGCSLLVKEGVNVKTSDSDQDDFVRNRVTILAEARVAFPVWRPSAFAIVAQGS